MHDLDELVGWIFCPLVAVAIAALPFFNVWLANRRLSAWAAHYGLTVLWKRVQWVSQGPFTLGLARARVVYRLRLQWANGADKVCWAACSTSLFDDEVPSYVDVRPDEAAQGFPVVTRDQ